MVPKYILRVMIYKPPVEVEIPRQNPASNANLYLHT